MLAFLFGSSQNRLAHCDALVKPEEEAEVYLAYGRVDQAKRIIETGLRDNPGSTELNALMARVIALQSGLSGQSGVAPQRQLQDVSRDDVDVAQSSGEDDIAYLQGQMKGLKGLCVGLICLCVILWLAALGLYALASYSVPLADLPYVDIPVGLKKMMAGVMGGGQDDLASNVGQAFASIADSGILKAVGLLSLLLLTFFGIASQNMGLAFAGVMVAACFAVTPKILGVVVGGESMDGGEVSMDAGRRGDLDAVASLIERGRAIQGEADGSMKTLLDYVEAQVKVASKKELSSEDQGWVGATALKDAQAEPAVVHFMERKLSGRAQSPMAMEYQRALMSQKQGYERWTEINAVAGLVVAALALLVYGLFRGLQQRSEGLMSA